MKISGMKLLSQSYHYIWASTQCLEPFSISQDCCMVRTQCTKEPFPMNSNFCGNWMCHFEWCDICCVANLFCQYTLFARLKLIIIFALTVTTAKVYDCLTGWAIQFENTDVTVCVFSPNLNVEFQIYCSGGWCYSDGEGAKEWCF